MLDLKKIQNDFAGQIEEVSSLDGLEALRLSYLGKNGKLTNLLSGLKELDVEARKSFGSELNKLKDLVLKEIQDKKNDLEDLQLSSKLKLETIDVTLPFRQFNKGQIHIISAVIEEVKAIFSGLGFKIVEGPEIEDDFHNFTALNIDEDHPARQMQDTFYMNDPYGKSMLLRTHTSSVQIRKMKEAIPPLKIISIGKVYRCDSDQTHSPMFHQIEALVVDEDVSMANLRWCLEEFLKKFFAVDDLPINFRPSFFPFTEPSAEVDIGYSKENGVIKVGGGKNFLEILGCGMVHPQVLENVGIDSKNYRGFAFGIGIERLAMLKYGVVDLRMFFESDWRFLKHYGFSPFES